MVAPVYTTDLATITNADVTTGESGALGTVTWSEPTGSTAGGTASVETDYFIQGTAIVAKSFNATGVGGLGAATATAATIPTDGAIFVWTYFSAPNAIGTKAAGGMQVIVGNTLANYKRFYVAGSDTYTFGGFVCYPMNPTVTASATQGTPSATVFQYFGMVTNVVNPIQRGNPFGVDAMRYGRGTLQCVSGDLANGYATFLGAATENDQNTATGPKYYRWGLLSLSGGTYKYQGHLLLGTAGTPVDFRDSGRTIFIQNTEFVTANFNLIEIRNAASNVEWDGISITSLGTVSPGDMTVTDNATVSIDGCTFEGMRNFTFQSNTAVIGSIFRECNTVIQGGADVTDTEFITPSVASGVAALRVSSLSNLTLVTGCSFTRGSVGHAIELQGAAGSTSLDSILFTGYAATNGSTGNEALYVNIASGTVTVNIVGTGGSTPSVRTAGATVVIVNAKTFTVTNIAEGTELRIFRQSDLVELAGAEVVGASPSGLNNVTIASDPVNAGRFTALYSYEPGGSDVPIFVVAMSLEYQWLRQSTALTSDSSTLQIVQQIDRQYSNPI